MDHNDYMFLNYYGAWKLSPPDEECIEDEMEENGMELNKNPLKTLEMKKEIFKKTAEWVGVSWENKIDNFIIKIGSDPNLSSLNDKELIRNLSENLLIRDLIFLTVFNVSDEDRAKLFELMLDKIEESEKNREKKLKEMKENDTCQ